MTSQKRYFTVEEANQTLPLVRSIVRDVVENYRDLHERHERLQAVKQRNNASRGTMPAEYNEELEQMEEEIRRDAEKLQHFVDELQELGVELKDLTKGLVDFPHLLEGREVYLCWMLGEGELAHWHEKDSGFQGRQSLMAGTSPTPDAGSGPLSA